MSENLEERGVKLFIDEDDGQWDVGSGHCALVVSVPAEGIIARRKGRQGVKTVEDRREYGLGGV